MYVCMRCSSFAHPTPLPTAGDGDSTVRGTRVDACSLDDCRHDRVRDLLPTARVDPARGQCDSARDHQGARLVGRALSHPAADAEFQGSAGRRRGERIGDAARGLRAGRSALRLHGERHRANDAGMFGDRSIEGPGDVARRGLEMEDRVQDQL